MCSLFTFLLSSSIISLHSSLSFCPSFFCFYLCRYYTFSLPHTISLLSTPFTPSSTCPFYPTIFLKRIKCGQGGKRSLLAEIYHTPFIVISSNYVFLHPSFHPLFFRVFTKTSMDKGVKGYFSPLTPLIYLLN